MKIIEITINPKGEARVQTKGFNGADCQQASRFLEQALGQCTKEQLTTEFHQSTNSVQQQQHAG
jgi:hypothetical protein